MTQQTKYLLLCTLSLIIALTNAMSALATDIQIETYASGGLTIALKGDWSTGIAFNTVKRVPGYLQNETAQWTGQDLVDYIDFTDDTSTAGFRITMTVTDLSYSGPGQQNPLPATDFTLYGEYSSSASAITKGYNDSTKNLSILPNSCETISTNDFTFHADFSNISKNYSLKGSNSAQTLITSTANCLAIGHLRFDRTEMPIATTNPNGTYTATITLTIIDGSA